MNARIKDSLQQREKEVSYCFGHTQSWLETASRSYQISYTELASRVATLLLDETGGEILRTEYNLPTLRSNSTKRNKTSRKMAMARGPYRKTQVKRHHSAETRKKISEFRKKWWREKKAEVKQSKGWTAKRRKEYSERMKNRALQRKLQKARLAA